MAKGYAITLVVVAAAVAIKLWVTGRLGREAPFLLLLSADSVSTWLGGRGPGLLAALLTTGALAGLFLPDFHGHREGWLALHTMAFGIEALLVAFLTSSIVAARRRAETLAARMVGMYRTSAALARSSTLREVAKVVATEGLQSLQAASVRTYVSTPSSPKLRVLAAAPPAQQPDAVATSDEVDPVAAAVRTRDLVFAESDAPTLWAPMLTRSCCVGVLEVKLAQGRTLTLDDRAFVLRLAQDGAFALERALQHDSERRARVEAEEVSRAKDEFLEAVSDQLRSPLTSIMGWTRMLRICPELGEGGRERALDVIERNVRAQERLVMDVLDISRIAARKLRLDKRRVDVTELAGACVESLQQEAARREVALSVTASERLAVLGDAERLRQVTTNLVSNALEFTPAGGHVCVEIEPGDEFVLLRVRDDGVGIAAAELPYVFEAFRQGVTRSGGRKRGVGLGLAIVKSLVREHGGSVRIDSDGPRRGTTATVCLPRCTDADLARAS